jgi:hypothetical protein
VIDQALDFLCNQVNNYLLTKLDPAPDGDAIILFNVSQLVPGNTDTESNPSNALITLVNIEEDRISKSQENFTRKENSIVYKNPKIYLNLYVLFSVNLAKYPEALKRLSFILTFFQYKNVFDTTNSPDLDPKIEKLIVDMYSLGFEQMNNLWGILGGKYLPSFLYKVRLVGIEEEAIDAESAFIKSIAINENNN